LLYVVPYAGELCGPDSNIGDARPPGSQGNAGSGQALLSSPSKWPLPAKGVRFLTPAFMLGKLDRNPLTRDCYPTAMGYYPQARGHAMRRERHDDNLLLYCVDGGGQLDIAEESWPVGPGHLVMLPQAVVHQYRALRREPWSIYWVHFQGSSAAVFMNYLGYREGHPVLDVGLSPALLAGFDSLLSVRRTGYSTVAFINVANQLRHLLTQFALESRRQGPQHGLDLAAIQAFMMENIDRQLELDTLASVANLSKYYFANRYKDLTGYSPIKHFLHMKIEYACQLLDSTDLSVQAIAAATGYTDPLYFSRLFSKTMGQSPRAYRASIRK
jgi:AraC-like DNA-binding protein